jgi:hypothetical protein
LAGTQLIIASPAEAPASPAAEEPAPETPSIPPTPVAQVASLPPTPVAQVASLPPTPVAPVAQVAPVPAAPVAPSIPPTPVNPVAPVITGPVATPAAPTPRPRPPKVESSEPTPNAPKQDKSLVVVLAAAVALGFLVTLAGGVAMVLHMRGQAPEADPPPEASGGSLEALAEDPPAPPEGGVEVTVKVSGEAKVQWIKLNQGDTTALKGDDAGLTGVVAPGEYELGVKVVGRPAAAVPLTVGDEGLNLSCTLDKAGKGACEGGAAPLTLSPG